VFYELFRSLLRNLLFNDNLQNDPDSKYFVFFTDDNAGDNLGRDFGTTQSILIQNALLILELLVRNQVLDLTMIMTEMDGSLLGWCSSIGLSGARTDLLKCNH
jgi:hypothetical protein